MSPFTLMLTRVALVKLKPKVDLTACRTLISCNVKEGKDKELSRPKLNLDLVMIKLARLCIFSAIGPTISSLAINVAGDRDVEYYLKAQRTEKFNVNLPHNSTVFSIIIY